MRAEQAKARQEAADAAAAALAADAERKAVAEKAATLQSVKDLRAAAAARSAARDQHSVSGVAAARKEHRGKIRSLKSDLKRSTALIKRVRAGVTADLEAGLLKDVETLNLTRYRATERTSLPVGPDFATYFKRSDARNPTLQTMSRDGARTAERRVGRPQVRERVGRRGPRPGRRPAFKMQVSSCARGGAGLFLKGSLGAIATRARRSPKLARPKTKTARP